MSNMRVERTEKVTKERWLNLWKSTWERDGKKGEWIFASRRMIERPVPGHVDAVIIVPVVPGTAKNGGNKVILTKQFRVPIQKVEYSFPAGLVDGKESIEDCARRELLEETGYEIKEVVSVSPPVYSSSGMTDENCVLVFCKTGPEPVKPQKLDEAEDIAVETFGLQGLIRLCLQTEYAISAKTWPVLYMYQRMGKIE